MSKEDLVAGFEEYSEPTDVDNAAEESDETPNTTAVCSAIASAIFTNKFGC